MSTSWEKFEREVVLEVTLKVTAVSAKGALKIAEVGGSTEIEGGTVVLKRSRNGQVYFNLAQAEEAEGPELDPKLAAKLATGKATKAEMMAALAAFISK
jgi:hypothetical protein